MTFPVFQHRAGPAGQCGKPMTTPAFIAFVLAAFLAACATQGASPPSAPDQDGPVHGESGGDGGGGSM